MDNQETSTKQFITSLLTSTPLVVSMQQLSKDYKNTIGEPIPYQKLGYNSLEHFLRSIDDTVQVMGSGPTAQIIPVISEKSAHVNNLVTKQKVNTNPKYKGRNFQFKRMTYVPLSSFNNSVTAQSARKIHYPSSTTSKSSDQSSSSLSYVTYASTTPANQKNCNETSSALKLTQDSSLNRNIKNEPQNEPMDKSSEDTNLKERQKLESKKKVVAKTTRSSSAKKCTSVKDLLKHPSSNKVSEQENRIPYYIRNNLRSVMTQCPTGIWCAELPDKYRKMFRQELDYQQLGFSSLIDLCVCLSSVFHYVRPSTEDFKLYDRSRPLPDCAEKKFTVSSYGVGNKKGYYNQEGRDALPTIDWSDVNTFLPRDIFKPGEEIPRVFIPSDVKENDNIDVVVGEVYDLSKFWVSLLDSPLDQLMDDLQDFYKEHAAEYEIPDHLIKEGLYCVQVIFGEYHRALIVDVMPEVEDTIRVIFIDYGTMTKVSTKGLCFLHLRFSTIPVQAIRCRLANICPTEEGLPWSKEASKAFRQMVVDRDTSAKISHINWEEQYLEVYLADVTNEDDIFYINDRLVEEGFGQYPDKERQTPRVDPTYTAIVKFIHLFPTFLELEHGLAPSTSEMEILRDCNVPVNFCYPQYFYFDYTFEEEIIAAAEEFHENFYHKAKRRVPIRFYDLDKLRPQPVDMTIFGELEADITAFLNRPQEEGNTHNSDEDFVDADEDLTVESCNEFDSITEQLKALNNKEEETVNVLKRDLQVTEGIMKDINMICKIEKLDLSNEEVCTEDFLYDGRDDVVICETDSIEEKFYHENERELWTINETRESVETSISTDVFRNTPDRNDNEVLFNHPLSNMSFDGDGLTEEEPHSSNSSYDLYEPDVQLKTVDFSSLANAECGLPDGEAFLSQITTMYNIDPPRSDSTMKNSEETCSLASTNPFLTDLTQNPRSEEELKLNPNNPFLTYVSKISNSSSSSSTVYETPIVQVKVQHSWSHFDDMSAETISKLGRSLSVSSKSSSTTSLKAPDDKLNCSISTQTSDEPVKPPQAQQPYFYPQQMAYGYAQWSLGYANSGYMQPPGPYGYQGYGPAYRPLVPPAPPGFPPPPGFAPLYPPQYGNAPPRMPRYGHAYYGPRPPTPAAAPTPSPAAAPSASSVSVSTVGDNKDFYTMYNEKLMKGGGDK